MYTQLQIIIRDANYLIQLKNYKVDYQQFKQFFQRNLNYYIKKQKSFVAKEKHSHNVYDMSNYFEKLQQVIREKSITDLDI